MLLHRTLTISLLVVSFSVAVEADTIVLTQDFDAEFGSGDGASGESSLNHSTFSNWSVTSGSVDLIHNGDYGIRCANNSGKCVDLDGGTLDAGTLTSDPISFAPGRYRISYQLAGVEASFSAAGAADLNTVQISVGELFAESVTREPGAAFEQFGGTFDVTEPTTLPLVFQNLGGDNFGAIVDEIELTLVSIPEPAAFTMLPFVILSVSHSRPRRRVKQCKASAPAQ